MSYIPSIEPDPREERLPRWARELLDNMRRRVNTAEATAEAARLVTQPDQTDTALYRYGDQSVGLPTGATIEFRLWDAPSERYNRNYVNCRVDRSRDGARLILHGGDAIRIEPHSSNSVSVTISER